MAPILQQTGAALLQTPSVYRFTSHVNLGWLAGLVFKLYLWIRGHASMSEILYSVLARWISLQDKPSLHFSRSHKSSSFQRERSSFPWKTMLQNTSESISTFGFWQSSLSPLLSAAFPPATAIFSTASLWCTRNRKPQTGTQGQKTGRELLYIRTHTWAGSAAV